MSLQEHQALLTAVDDAFKNLVITRQTSQNLVDIRKCENDWQEALEAYDDFFRSEIGRSAI